MNHQNNDNQLKLTKNKGTQGSTKENNSTVGAHPPGSATPASPRAAAEAFVVGEPAANDADLNLARHNQVGRVRGVGRAKVKVVRAVRDGDEDDGVGGSRRPAQHPASGPRIKVPIAARVVKSGK